MKFRRMLQVSMVVAGILTAVMALSGCGAAEDKDPKTMEYTSWEDAVKAVTKETQTVLTEIEAREGKRIVVWENTSAEDTAPFTLGLLEKDGENWEITDTRGVTMTDSFSGGGVYPVQDGLISYAVSPSIDDPVAQNFAEHQQTENWCFHWTIVPELPQ